MTRAKSKPSMPKASKPKASKPMASKPLAAKPKASTPAAAKAKSSKPVAGKLPLSKLKAPTVAPVKAAPKAAPVKAAPVKAAPVKAAPVKPPPAQVVASKPKAAKPEPSKPKAVVAARPSVARVPTPPVLVAVPSKAKPTKSAKSAPAPVRLDTPAKIRPIEQAVGVSSDAVARRTGKSWAEWFALLDAAGAAELDHKGIVAVLAQRHGVGPWWQQMVTVAYEQARGKRETQAADEGFQVGVSKTLELPLAKLFRFWSEPAERNKWLADDRFSIHKATASKSIRARWGRGVSRIDVDFCEKGPTKSQVTVQHNRIETSDAADQMRAYWDKKIRALEALLTRP
jgi:hypothetical protein